MTIIKYQKLILLGIFFQLFCSTPIPINPSYNFQFPRSNDNCPKEYENIKKNYKDAFHIPVSLKDGDIVSANEKIEFKIRIYDIEIIKDVKDETKKLSSIDDFKQKFDSKKNKYKVLIINIKDKNDSTLAFFNDKDEFKEVSLDSEDELKKELEKPESNQDSKKINNLLALKTGHTQLKNISEDLFYHVFIREDNFTGGTSYIQNSGKIEIDKDEYANVFFGKIDSYEKKYLLIISVNAVLLEKILEVAEFPSAELPCEIYRKSIKLTRDKVYKRLYCVKNDQNMFTECKYPTDHIVIKLRKNSKDKKYCFKINNSRDVTNLEADKEGEIKIYSLPLEVIKNIRFITCPSETQNNTTNTNNIPQTANKKQPKKNN